MTVAFDHLMVMVDDEERAAEAFANAGYAVTPRSELPGMANRLVCFPSAVPHAACFLELLAIHRRDEVPPPIRAFLGDGLGPRAVVVAVKDMEAYSARLKELGVQFAGPMSIRRQWTLDNGEVLAVHLEILLPEYDVNSVRWVAVKHHTVHHYLRDEFVRHRYDSIRLDCLVLSAGDPRRVAEHLAQMWDTEAVFYGGSACVRLAGADLLIQGRDELAADADRAARIVGVLMSGQCDHASWTIQDRLQLQGQAADMREMPLVPGLRIYSL